MIDSQVDRALSVVPGRRNTDVFKVSGSIGAPAAVVVATCNRRKQHQRPAFRQTGREQGRKERKKEKMKHAIRVHEYNSRSRKVA